MIRDQIRAITGAENCDYGFKRGWWCSRHRCHPGPCALRPRIWNIRGKWEYDWAYRRPTFNTINERLHLPFRMGHAGRTLTGIGDVVHQNGRYAIWGKRAAKVRWGRLGWLRALLDFPSLRKPV